MFFKQNILKRLFSFFLLFVSIFANATNYFVSNSGNDANSGTSAGSPWATVSKVNSFALQPGDIVSFNGGQSFIGPLNSNRSGTNGNPITFNSYGTGKAIIIGWTTLGAWTSLGGGLYEQVISAAQSTLNMVLRDGSFQPIGRYPNLGDNTNSRQNGYNIVGSVGGSSIGSNQTLPVSFAGGEVVIRAVHWILDRHTITSNTTGTGSTINFSGGGYTPTSGFGYFIQNVPNATTLDVLGDWAYTPASKKITMFFGGGGPGASVVKAATVQNLVTLASVHDIAFTNIQFDGSNNHLFSVTGNTTRITLTDVDMSNAGVDGMNTGSGNSFITYLRVTSTRCNNNHIRSNNASDWNITNSTFRYNGMAAGMGGSGDGTYFATSDIGNNSLVQYNVIKNSGYVGINYNGSAASGNNIRILNNFIDSFCVVKDDGAGIYTGDVSGYNAHTQCRIENNIVDHGLGAGPGAGGAGIFGQTSGIYMDDYSINTIINGNTVARCFASGIYLHLAKDITVTNNTTFANGNQEVRIVAERSNGPIRNLTINNNIWFNMTADNVQNFFTMVIRSVYTAGGGEQISPLWGTWNNNFYCRPINSDNQQIIVIQPAPSFVGTLPQWKTASGKDQNSQATLTPISTNPANYRLEYNATQSAVVRSLGANYRDVRGTVYAGSITLQPYTSAVLMLTGSTNSLPIVSAGADQSITLPTNSVSVTGTATDPDGSIASRQWTKTIGGAATITSPTSATTTITGLVQGGYTFQFCATDNSGGTSCDVMSVTVNAAPVVPPVSNAGPDRTIQLPTQTTTLNGSGSDADGTITGYLWTKISGPAAGTIASASQPVTAINNLTIAGTYQYNLRVTDNQGNIDDDQVTVLVNPAANQPPIVSAGANQTITLPTSQVTVTATASDPDGTIASYLWTKISGPAGGTITSASSASTTITGYTNAGTYIYQVLVTDNGGLTASATTQITVNAAPPVNQPPVVNAGADRAITLPTATITQVGSATDADGTVAAYLWTKVSGPSVTIASPTASTTAFNGLSAGTYIFQLRATDNLGSQGTDQFTLIVTAAPNQPPVANAGPDQVKTLPTTTATMAGSATDPDGTIVSTVWSQIGGTASTITTTTSLTTTITGLTTAGSRTYRLLVTDNIGATDDDTMIILVNPAPNQPPVANAGTDKNITLPTNSVTQVGSGTDADGTIVGYLWTQVSGPASNIVSAAQATTVINGLGVGVRVYNLRVTDNSGATANDQMTITVNAAPVPPTVSAGANQTITLPTSSVTLTATASDPDGTISSYAWTKISGPSGGTITSASSASTTVTGYTNAGTYVYQVLVTDNSGLTASSTTQIIVNAAPPPNQPPIVNAGPDKSITLPTNSTSLAGSATDPGGSVVSYLWTKVSGGAATIVTPAQSTTTINGLVQGTYIFQLAATDNLGAVGTDQVTVIVNAAPNLPPVVNAGADQTITLPTTTTTLAGNATDPDGTIVSHVWNLLSGPASATITTPASYTSGVTGLTVAGSYYLKLSANDNLGLTSTDTMIILVNPAPNQPPVANAGPSQYLSPPISQTVLNGTSSTDPDGTIVSWLWTKFSGPTTYNIVSASQPLTVVNNLGSGFYVFNLRVTDNRGGFSNDTVSIQVDTLPIPPSPTWIPPVSNAGPDRFPIVCLFCSTTSQVITGSGTSTYGTIVGYQWVKISGPSGGNISSPNTASTNITSLQRGTYVYRLTVTDNMGYTNTNDMQILVTKNYLIFRNGRLIIVNL